MTVINLAATVLLEGVVVTANGNLFIAGDNASGNVNTNGYNGLINLVIQKTGSGTCSVTPQSSFDGGVTWYSVGYQNTDGQATLTRATGAITVAGGTVNHVYQILDPAPMMRFVVSATSGTVSLTPFLFYSPL